MFTPAGARRRVAQVVRVDGAYEDFEGDGAVTLSTLPGTAAAEGVMKVESEDGVTLVFNDAIFNMPHVRGGQGFVLRYITRSSGGPRVTRVSRLFLIRDARAFRAELERLAETPRLVRVIVSHHLMITDDPRAALLAVAASV